MLERIGIAVGIAAATLLCITLAESPVHAAAPGCTDDRDGDGHRSIACGGDDCDDDNPAQYPGNVEICDTVDLDEDCDPSTFGPRDADSDGLIDSRCCNLGNCGTDCDDANAAVLIESVVCNGERPMLCRGGELTFTGCFAGTMCIPQPNGTGVCATPPPGYVAPATFATRKLPKSQPSQPTPTPKPKPKVKKVKKPKKPKQGPLG